MNEKLKHFLENAVLILLYYVVNQYCVGIKSYSSLYLLFIYYYSTIIFVTAE